MTTLTKRHVSVEGDEIAFCFRAKNRKLVRRTLVDRTLADAVEQLLALPGGSRLFRFERDEEFFHLTSALLNEYIAENRGEGYTAKDFRTWGGTLRAAVELERRGPPDSERDAKRVLAGVMRLVGDELGNTAAVARESYVSPVVIDHYLSGCTIADFRSENGARPVRVSQTELALIRMLRARAA